MTAQQFTEEIYRLRALRDWQGILALAEAHLDRLLDSKALSVDDVEILSIHALKWTCHARFNAERASAAECEARLAPKDFAALLTLSNDFPIEGDTVEEKVATLRRELSFLTDEEWEIGLPDIRAGLAAQVAAERDAATKTTT